MKKLLTGLIAMIALLNLGSGVALADDPRVSVTPDVRTARNAAALLGFGSLPFTGAAAEPLGSLGVLLGMSGLALLYLRRKGLTWELARAIHRSGR